ncbi:MAG: ABC transporter substrate-binding protein [Microbacterium sp.]
MRTRRRPRSLIALGLAAALGLLAGCGSAATGDSDAEATPVSGGTYVHALEGEPGCLDPAQQRYHVALNVARQTVDSLVDQDPETGEIVPWIADSWQVSDDAQTFTFHVRDGATFADGTVIDAAAVKANFDRIAALGTVAVGANPIIQGYVGTTVVDDATVQIDFDRPNVQFLQGVSGAWFGLISVADTQRSAEELCSGDYVGSGPFVFSSYTPQKEVVLTKRVGYDTPSSLADHDGDAYVDELKFLIVTEASVRAGSVQSGEVDSASAIAKQDQATLAAAGDDLLSVKIPGLTESVIVNQESWLADDEPVRQALKYAINSQEIVDTIYGDSYSSRIGLLGSSTPYASDFSDDLAFDLDKAIQLLEDDGWVLGDDGIRVKDGQRLEIDASGISSYADAELLQQQWKAAGIDVPIVTYDTAAATEKLSSGDYDIHLWTMTRADPDLLNAIWNSTRTSFGYARAVPSSLDDLLLAQAAATDSAERQELVDQIQEYLITNAWGFPVSDRAWVYGLNPTSHGLRLDGETKLVFYDVWKTA